MSCNKCSELRKTVSKLSCNSKIASYPSIRELACIVNLEYYVNMELDCIHKIPEDDKACLKIKDLVKFLDEKKWQMGIRTNYKGFHCTTFLNRPEKKLVIVHRGTEMTNFEQIKTDFMLAINQVTQDVIIKADWHTTQSLINNALKEDSNRFVRNDYSVTITGHSLGGWLAQLCTLIAKNPQFYPFGPRGVFTFPNGKSIDMSQSIDLHCVTFDSPGAFAVLSKMEKDAALLSGTKCDIENALCSLDITVYLSNPNVVNKCGKQVGLVKRIDVMTDASFLESWFNPFSSHKMKKILNYFIKNDF